MGDVEKSIYGPTLTTFCYGSVSTAENRNYQTAVGIALPYRILINICNTVFGIYERTYQWRCVNQLLKLRSLQLLSWLDCYVKDLEFSKRICFNLLVSKLC
jgi:hypothetical protein